MKKNLFAFLVIALFAISSYGQCGLTITGTDATCSYNCNGSATANATGTPPFNFYWDNGAISQTNDNLCAGTTYSCMITDAVGCSSNSIQVTISSPPAITFLPDTIHDETCYGACNGDATIYPIGGTPPYTYDWGNGQTTQQATSLCANVDGYYVNVNDSNSCAYSHSVYVNGPTQIVNTPNIMPTYCSTPTGYISLSTSGGVTGAGYNYLWSNGGNMYQIFSLPSGIYSVTVSDGVGCSVVDTYIVNPTDGVHIDSLVPKNVTCFGMNNGGLGNIGFSGGMLPLTFQWTGQTPRSIPTLDPVGPGNYYLTITDNNSCNTYGTITVIEPPLLIDNPGITHNYCFGDSIGNVYLMPSGGTPGGTFPYTFTWGTLPLNNTSMAYNLHAGTYPVTITDANGCTLSENIVVSEPPQLIANVTPVDISCYGFGDGMVIMNMTGGTAPYYFSLDSLPNNWSSYDTIFSLTAGTYNVYIKDEHYCFLPHVTFLIVEPSLLNVSGSQTDPTCADNDGIIHLTTTGGVYPYIFNWSNSAFDSVLVNLPQGNYNVTVTDAHGCVNEQYYYLNPSSEPAKLWGKVSYSGGIVQPNDAEVLLFGNSTGMSQIDTISTTINSASTWEFSNLLPGTYYLKANILNSSSYPNVISTYYDSTFTWSLANALSLNCNDTVYINFKMFESTFSNPGNGSLSGTISMYTAGKAAGEPVPGAEILVEQDPNDVPIKSVPSDTTGKYIVTGLGIGTGYHLLVDIPGLPLLSTYQNLAFTVTDTVHNNLNFLVDTITGTGIYASNQNYVSILNSGVNVNVYPNPFTSNINITIKLDKPEMVSIDLFDALGRKIQSIENKEMQLGENNINIIPTAKYSGICYLMIKTGKNVFVKKLISNQK